MAAIESRLAGLRVEPIPWAASPVVEEIDAGTFDASGLYLYRLDGLRAAG